MSLKSISFYVKSRFEQDDLKEALEYQNNYIYYLIASQKFNKDIKPFINILDDFKKKKNKSKDKTEQEIINDIMAYLI